MSSHHFVKEEQEPSLLILKPVSLSRIAPLLEWAPLVVVIAGAVDVVSSWGIKMDVVVGGNRDLQGMMPFLQDQQPLEIVAVEEGDWIDEAFKLLVEKNQKAVNVVGNYSKDLLMKLETVANEIQVVLIDSDVRWTFTSRYEKWLPQKQKMLIPLLEIQIKDGLEPEREDGSYFTLKDGMVRLRHDTPFWIGEVL